MFRSQPSLEETLFNMKFSTKQMERAARKCEKEQKVQQSKVKKALEQGNVEGARIYAENAIRKKNEGLNYLRMAARIDAVASRVRTAMMHREEPIPFGGMGMGPSGQLTKSMGGVVKGMDKVLQSMNLEKIGATMEKFEGLFQDLDVHTQVMDSTMDSAMTLSTPQDQVEGLIKQVAEESGMEVLDQLSANPVASGTPSLDTGVETLTGEQEDQLSRRLAALRN